MASNVELTYSNKDVKVEGRKISHWLLAGVSVGVVAWRFHHFNKSPLWAVVAVCAPEIYLPFTSGKLAVENLVRRCMK